MFKDKEKQKEYHKELMRKERAVTPQAQGVTEGEGVTTFITPWVDGAQAPKLKLVGVTEVGVTGTKGTENTGFSFYKRKYPALVYAVADQDKRKRLTRVCEELKSRHLLTEVTYGMGGPRFDVVQDVLECLT